MKVGGFFDDKVAACVNSYTYGHDGFKGLGYFCVLLIEKSNSRLS